MFIIKCSWGMSVWSHFPLVVFVYPLETLENLWLPTWYFLQFAVFYVESICHNTVYTTRKSCLSLFWVSQKVWLSIHLACHTISESQMLHIADNCSWWLQPNYALKTCMSALLHACTTNSSFVQLGAAKEFWIFLLFDGWV